MTQLPVLDAGRGTLTLPRRLVPIVMLLGAGGRVDATAQLRDVVELERAGIAPGGRLHPLAAGMLRVVTDPRRVITVNVETDDRAISTIWVREHRAVLGRAAGSELFELRPVEVGLLTFHLAQLVRISSGRDPAYSGSVTVPAATLDALADSWKVNPEHAARRLVSEGVEPVWADRLVSAHRGRRARWRVASLWVARDGSARDEEVIVLDGADAGYWQVLVDPERLGQVTLATRRFVDVLELLQMAAAGE